MYRTGNVTLLTIGLVATKFTDFLRVRDHDGLMDFTHYTKEGEKSHSSYSLLLSGVLSWLLPPLATGIETWNCRHRDFLPHVGACGTLKHPCLLEKLQGHPAPQEITPNQTHGLMDIIAPEGTPLTLCIA